MPNAGQVEKMENDAITRKADKERDAGLATVSKIKDVDFNTWRRQLERLGFSFGWHASILTLDALDPDDATLKHELDLRNAFLIIMWTTDGHDVQSSLEQVTMGDAREAFKTVHNHFHPNSMEGRMAAYDLFYGATMANTGTNILVWISTVKQRARVAAEAGALINDQAQLVKLLGGLLPEFDNIKDILNHMDQLSFKLACTKLIGYAQSKKIEHLTKDGDKNGKVNSFTIDDRKAGTNGRTTQQPCYQWVKGKCRWGEECRYIHNGPGGTVPPRDNRRSKARPSAPPAPSAPEAAFVVADQCGNCHGSHKMKECPAAANVFTANDVDYVFMTHTEQDSDSDDVIKARAWEARPSGGPSGGPPGALRGRINRLVMDRPLPHSPGNNPFRHTRSGTLHGVGDRGQRDRESHGVTEQTNDIGDHDRRSGLPQCQSKRMRDSTRLPGLCPGEQLP